jgi:uncharacterized coiled-coil DUF342 family protein
MSSVVEQIIRNSLDIVKNEMNEMQSRLIAQHATIEAQREKIIELQSKVEEQRRVIAELKTFVPNHSQVIELKITGRDIVVESNVV